MPAHVRMITTMFSWQRGTFDKTQPKGRRRKRQPGLVLQEARPPVNWTRGVIFMPSPIIWKSVRSCSRLGVLFNGIDTRTLVQRGRRGFCISASAWSRIWRLVLAIITTFTSILHRNFKCPALQRMRVWALQRRNYSSMAD